MLAHVALAQKVKDTDTVRTYTKTAERIKFYPRAFRVGTDVISLGKTMTMATFTGWEMNGDVDFGKYYFAFDYGSWGKDKTLPDSGFYHNSGTYWRAGVDVNLLKKDPDRNMFFLGFRYGRSSFNELTGIYYTDPHFGEIQKILANTNMTAGWGELVLGLRVKMWKQFWMGYTARLKFALSTHGDTEFKNYDVPGYGLSANQLYWGFNYQIFWSIPFSKQKAPTIAVPK